MTDAKKTAVIVSATLAAGAVLYALVYLANALDGGKESGVRGAGWMGAKQSILPVLNDPDSADFPWNTVWEKPTTAVTVSGTEYKRWLVGGKVRAKNAFGGVVSQDWVAHVLSSGDGNLVVSRVTLDGKDVFVSSSYRTATD